MSGERADKQALRLRSSSFGQSTLQGVGEVPIIASAGPGPWPEQSGAYASRRVVRSFTQVCRVVPFFTRVDASDGGAAHCAPRSIGEAPLRPAS